MANQNEELSLRDSYLQQTGEMLAGLIRVGVVEKADYDKCLFRVAINDTGGDSVLKDWLPMINLRANLDITWWPLEVGEQVAVLSPSGNLTAGVILGSIYQNKYRPKANKKEIHRIDFQNGDYVRYDRTKGDLEIRVSGDLILNGKRILFNDPASKPIEYN